jgi:hypothetical protein
MIIDEYVVITVNKKNIDYYKSKGYDTSNKKLKIKIKDLIPGSHLKINVKCDICFKEKEIIWREYYKSFINGNLYCCSSKCSQVKNKKTCLEKYGVDNPTKSKEILLKREESNLVKYGVKYPNMLDSFKESVKKTCLEKYGVDNPTKNKEIYQKVKKTINDKYGNDIFFKTEYFKSNKNNYYRQYNNINFLNKRILELKRLNIDLISIDNDNNYIINCKNNHIYTINNDVLYKRLNVYNVDLCTICNPVNNRSSKEDEIFDFINSIYDGTILRNVRDVIDPYEIDIYLPDLKIGFEFNGIYWHSELYKDKFYHSEKYIKSKEYGIKLFQIWEDDWLYKKDILKSIIKNKLGLTKKKIFARKCKVIVYNDNKITKKFLQENHLQGDCKSNIKIGLLYNDELVSLMTFSKNRYGIGSLNKDNYELTRYAVKKDIMIIGGASKLLKYFINNYKFNTIVSFSDCDISNGDLYLKIGFKYHSMIKPTYYYIINNKREHRFKWRKSNLIKINLLKENETEHECMKRIGFNRVYNSGHYKFIIKNSEI